VSEPSGRKVTRRLSKNAGGLQSPALMLTTEAMIADVPDEKGDGGMGGGGMGGMGMGSNSISDFRFLDCGFTKEKGFVQFERSLFISILFSGKYLVLRESPTG